MIFSESQAIKQELDLYRKACSEIEMIVMDDNPEKCQERIQEQIQSLHKTLSKLRQNPEEFLKESLKNDVIKNLRNSSSIREINKQAGLKKIKVILNYLRDNFSIDEESMRYHPEDYPFTTDEFMGFYDYLYDLNENNTEYRVYKETPFPETRMYFKYKSQIFIWRMLVGQGTACQLHSHHVEWPQYWPMEFDKNRYRVLPDDLGE